MTLAELTWVPDWVLLLAGAVAIVLIWQGFQNRMKIAELEKKIDRLEARASKTDGRVEPARAPDRAGG